MNDYSSFLRTLFDRAVEVADPIRSLAAHLPPKPNGRVVIVGAGKASARMAEAVEAEWGPCEGLIITRYGYARPCAGIEIVEASHPVPDEAGLQATKRMLTLLGNMSEGEFVLALISGGASALLVAPSNGITLVEKQGINEALLVSGAPISDMNTVRKHLSSVKGGQLAAVSWPAKMHTLLISDVPGDDPAFIGSGPTVGDNSTPKDALAVLEKWNVEISKSITNALERKSGVVLPNDEKLSTTENHLYAAPIQSLEAAADIARLAGCNVQVISDSLEGEARMVAREHANQVLELKAARLPNTPSTLLLSGGELTVTRSGNGIGGPNAEYCLALAIALDGVEGVHGIACDTDGVDGAAEVAGAIITPETLVLAKERGIDAAIALKNNDAHSFFEKIGGQVITGPTLTNVNDFRAILII